MRESVTATTLSTSVDSSLRFNTCRRPGPRPVRAVDVRGPTSRPRIIRYPHRRGPPHPSSTASGTSSGVTRRPDPDRLLGQAAQTHQPAIGRHQPGSAPDPARSLPILRRVAAGRRPRTTIPPGMGAVAQRDPQGGAPQGDHRPAGTRQARRCRATPRAHPLPPPTATAIGATRASTLHVTPTGVCLSPVR